MQAAAGCWLRFHGWRSGERAGVRAAAAHGPSLVALGAATAPEQGEALFLLDEPAADGADPSWRRVEASQPAPWEAVALSRTHALLTRRAPPPSLLAVALPARQIRPPPSAGRPLALQRAACLPCAGARELLAVLDDGAELLVTDGDCCRLLPAPAGERIVALAAGAAHALAVSAPSGHVLAWGWGAYGQLGADESPEPEPEPAGLRGLGLGLVAAAQLPRPLALRVRVVQVAAGAWHSLALSELGELYAWGHGAHGQLGLGPARLACAGPKRLKALEDEHVVQVAAGARHSVALTQRGRAWAWGFNQWGAACAAERPDEQCVFSPHCLRSYPTPGRRLTAVGAGGWFSWVLEEEASR